MESDYGTDIELNSDDEEILRLLNWAPKHTIISTSNSPQPTPPTSLPTATAETNSNSAAAAPVHAQSGGHAAPRAPPAHLDISSPVHHDDAERSFPLRPPSISTANPH